MGVRGGKGARIQTPLICELLTLETIFLHYPKPPTSAGRTLDLPKEGPPSVAWGNFSIYLCPSSPFTSPVLSYCLSPGGPISYSHSPLARIPSCRDGVLPCPTMHAATHVQPCMHNPRGGGMLAPILPS